MEPNGSNDVSRNRLECGTCGKKIKPENTFIHRSRILCEECCIDARTPHVRKTHWQYLGSIKADCLIPGKNSRSGGT